MRAMACSAETIAIMLSFRRADLVAWATEIEGHLLQWARELDAADDLVM